MLQENGCQHHNLYMDLDLKSVSADEEINRCDTHIATSLLAMGLGFRMTDLQALDTAGSKRPSLLSSVLRCDALYF